jgi:hypothetical protein
MLELHDAINPIPPPPSVHVQCVTAALSANGKKAPGSARCLQYLCIAMDTVAKAGASNMDRILGLGQMIVIETSLLLHCSWITFAKY